MNSIESRCVIGLENVLFAGASVHLSARKLILQAGAVTGLNATVEGLHCMLAALVGRT